MSKSSKEFYCTCQIKHYENSSKRRDECRHLKFHRTEVDDEDCCVHCGYYAWAVPQYKIYPRRSIVPWRDEVMEVGGNGWTNNTELRDAYFAKTVYSDHDLELGAAYNEMSGTKRLREKSFVEDLCNVYIGWGGNDHE